MMYIPVQVCIMYDRSLYDIVMSLQYIIYFNNIINTGTVDVLEQATVFYKQYYS